MLTVSNGKNQTFIKLRFIQLMRVHRFVFNISLSFNYQKRRFLVNLPISPSIVPKIAVAMNPTPIIIGIKIRTIMASMPPRAARP